MQTLQAVITGAMQGLSEFLPISSSAHIVFSNELYELITKTAFITSKEEEIFFDIMVHLATLFAVLIYFFNDLKAILKDFFVSIKEKDYKNKNFLLTNYILLSTVITGIIGLIFKEKVEYFIQNPKYICFFLFITGLILLFSEKMYKGNKEINLKSSILIAIAQGLAIFPGFSRSGLTISTGLFLGLNRVEAARFSFLMSIPVILLASMIYPLMSLDFNLITTFNLKAIAIGFLVSFVVGYLCIKYFMKLLGKLTLKSFAYYCLVISPLMFFVFEAFYRQ
ncbi:MAG: undecaprenyl-diphosphate phosphatase [Candidatus Gastranaerophilales bacterium]|nr:undecaprenyl-diphosphate phosphatase [Candidatus Gastranaerophilales bacterium]